jgi:hypothetical protein
MVKLWQPCKTVFWNIGGRIVQIDDMPHNKPDDTPPGDVLCATVDGQLKQLTIGDPPKILIIK